jgi:hypothetical protein
MGGACRLGGGRKRRVQSFVREIEEKRPLGRPRRRWDDNIKMDIQEMGWGVRIGLSWLRIEKGGGNL